MRVSQPYPYRCRFSLPSGGSFIDNTSLLACGHMGTLKATFPATGTLSWKNTITWWKPLGHQNDFLAQKKRHDFFQICEKGSLQQTAATETQLCWQHSTTPEVRKLLWRTRRFLGCQNDFPMPSKKRIEVNTKMCLQKKKRHMMNRYCLFLKNFDKLWYQKHDYLSKFKRGCLEKNWQKSWNYSTFTVGRHPKKWSKSPPVDLSLCYDHTSAGMYMCW